MAFTSRLTEINDGTFELVLGGVIDSRAQLPVDQDFSGYHCLYIDFEHVEYINSVGIKVWVNFVDYLSQYPKLEIYLRKCNRLIVDQINRVFNFIPTNGSVSSVYVPMYCVKCDSFVEVYQDTNNQRISTKDLVALANQKAKELEVDCEHRWEPDFYEDEYFRFLSFKKTAS